MNERLEVLKKELEKGQQRLAMLYRERQELRDTMLRISGAIQVLQELAVAPLLAPEETAEAAVV
jgi:hypothetical protein